MQYFNKNVPFIDAFVRFHALEKNISLLILLNEARKPKLDSKQLLLAFAGHADFVMIT